MNRRRCVEIALAIGSALCAGSCGCPTVSGPTAPVVTVSGTLTPGEFRFLDADTPKSTTQINLRFAVSSVIAPLRVRQIDPLCLPTAADTCPALNEQMLTPRPAGVYTFGSGFPVTGAHTRIIVQNMSADETITVSMSIEPHQAGCT